MFWFILPLLGRYTYLLVFPESLFASAGLQVWWILSAISVPWRLSWFKRNLHRSVRACSGSTRRDSYVTKCTGTLFYSRSQYEWKSSQIDASCLINWSNRPVSFTALCRTYGSRLSLWLTVPTILKSEKILSRGFLTITMHLFETKGTRPILSG